MLMYSDILRSRLLWYVWIKYGNHVTTRHMRVHQSDELFKMS